MKYLPTVFIALIVGTIVYFVQNHRIKNLEEKNSENSTQEPAKTTNPRSTPGATPNRRTPVTNSDQERPLSETDKKLRDLPQGGQSMADVMQSEAGRAMIKQGIEQGIPIIYGDFIDSLSLTDEEAKYFKELLTNRMLDQQQMGMKWLQANEAEREAIALEIEASREKSSAQIDEFLQSEDDSAAFKKYETQLPERQQMRGVRNALSDEPLTPELEEQLVETLYEARINSGEGTGNDDENWQKIGETGDFSVIEERWKATDEQIAQKLPEILTPTQTEAFLTHWKTARAMQTMQYKMGMQMIGSDKK